MYRNRRTFILLALLFGGILAGFLMNARQVHSEDTQQKTKWEYKIIRKHTLAFDPSGKLSDSDYFLQQLNKLGDDGWELVSPKFYNSSGGMLDVGEYIFKRAK